MIFYKKPAFCRRCTPSSTRAKTEVEEAAAAEALDQVFRRAAAAAVATADKWADSPTSQRRKEKEFY